MKTSQLSTLSKFTFLGASIVLFLAIIFYQYTKNTSLCGVNLKNALQSREKPQNAESSIKLLQAQLDSEKENHIRDQKLLYKRISELSVQNEKLNVSLFNARNEISNTQNYYIYEINKTNATAKKQIDDLIIKFNQLHENAQERINSIVLQKENIKNNYESKILDLNNKLTIADNKINEMKQRTMIINQENVAFKTFSKNAAVDNKQLRAENTKLSATVQHLLAEENRNNHLVVAPRCDKRVKEESPRK